MDEKRVKGKKRGAILIVTFMAIVVLVIISVGMFLRMLSESRAAERHRDATEAFYLAEAAIDTAVAQLTSDNNNTTSETGASLGRGRYSFTITPLAGRKWDVVAMGYIPAMPPNDRAHKTIEVFLEIKPLGDWFWNNAVTSSGPVTFNGAKTTTVTNTEAGDEFHDVYGGHSIDNPWGDDRIQKNADELKDGLPKLNFPDLASKATYTYAGDLDHKAWPSGVPTTFWIDEAAGTFNIIYIEGNLKLGGNDHIGGFIIVGGDVIKDIDISGTPVVDGCIYTRGAYSTPGASGNITINGGIWAGEGGCTISGNSKITYNKDYMGAIRKIPDISTMVQLISWREE